MSDLQETLPGVPRVQSPTTFTITVIVRHSKGCPHGGDETSRQCSCWKSLRIYEGGKQYYVKTKVRSWAAAEKVAEAERRKRDPKYEKERKVEAILDAKIEAEHKRLEGARTPIPVALAQWRGSIKGIKHTSYAAYLAFTRRFERWAKREHLETLGEVTKAHLERWRSSWDPDADLAEDRLAINTQHTLQVRIKSFFAWAVDIDLIAKDPARRMKAIPNEKGKTHPLDPEQFNALLDACEKFNATLRYKRDYVGQHLFAAFLVQRWTGLRIGDVVALPKNILRGRRMRVRTAKRGVWVDCILPDYVVEALTTLPELEQKVHPDYFFWDKNCSILGNTNKWLRKVNKLAATLDFKDQLTGEPLHFHTHMLRDTFAVEMLLSKKLTIEQVSKLLGHASIKTTQDYYLPWVNRRMKMLENDTIDAMRAQGVTVTVKEEDEIGHITSDRTFGQPLPKPEPPKPQSSNVVFFKKRRA